MSFPEISDAQYNEVNVAKWITVAFAVLSWLVLFGLAAYLLLRP